MTGWDFAPLLAVGVFFFLLWILWSKRRLSEVVAVVIKMIVTLFLIALFLPLLGGC